MISAVVDTNVLVSGVISTHPNSASKGVLDALLDGRFLLLLSPEILEEIQRMLLDREIRAKHGQTEVQVLDFCRVLQLLGRMLDPAVEIKPSLTRDVTDTKWVALSLEAGADYLITLDTRHLRRLKRVGNTHIVTPRRFLKYLDRLT